MLLHKKETKYEEGFFKSYTQEASWKMRKKYAKEIIKKKKKK